MPIRACPTVFVLAAVAACSEYEVGKDVDPGGPSPTTATGTASPTPDTTPPDPPDSADTGTPPDGCFAPDFGYASSPAARLVTTDGATPVVVTLVLSDTAYQDSLVLDEPGPPTPLMDAWSTSVGSAVSVGPYAVGTELVFGIDVQNTGDHWQSGPASRNADGVAHVAVTYEGACSWLIGFEDLYGGGDLDYNDVVFRVQGLLVQQ
jgi:hypothetical protein